MIDSEKKPKKTAEPTCTAADHFKSGNRNRKGYPADIADKIGEQDEVTKKYGFPSDKLKGDEGFNKGGRSADKFQGAEGKGTGKSADGFEGAEGKGKGKSADNFEHTAEGGCRLVQQSSHSLAQMEGVKCDA
jgi:hypothetical protein